MPPHVNVHVEMIMSALKMKLPMLSKSARCNRGLRTGAAGRCALAAERPIPVGIVSPTYSLAPHREVASLCRNGLIDAGIEPSDLLYEIGTVALEQLICLSVWCRVQPANQRVILLGTRGLLPERGEPTRARAPDQGCEREQDDEAQVTGRDTARKRRRERPRMPLMQMYTYINGQGTSRSWP